VFGKSSDSALQQMVPDPRVSEYTKHLSLPGLQAIAIVFYMICEISQQEPFRCELCHLHSTAGYGFLDGELSAPSASTALSCCNGLYFVPDTAG